MMGDCVSPISKPSLNLRNAYSKRTFHSCSGAGVLSECTASAAKAVAAGVAEAENMQVRATWRR